MEDRIKNLIQQADYLFGQRESLVSLWQEISEQFYPERADFTATRYIGTDFAANLTTSLPIIARRDLANIFSSMLRHQQWFFMGTSRDDRIDQPGKQWLEWATKLMRNAMEDPVACFKKATTECDNDYAAFGQGVISLDIVRSQNALLYRNWHLRDVVWLENAYGKIDTFFRKQKIRLRNLNKLFPGKLARQLTEKVAKEPNLEVNILHCVVPSEEYDAKLLQPYASVWIDRDNNHVLQESGKWTTVYKAPRWQTISGSQYAYSPAVVAALPEARLIQAISLTLLEAGEMAVRPPMTTPADKIRSDLQIYAGGVTTYDAEYDERTGEILKPIQVDKSGLSFGLGMHERAAANIREAFMLNKLQMAPTDPNMTAYQVAQLVQANILNMMPLFGPTEIEYNGGLCELTFEELSHNGAFGPPDSIPESIRGADVKFRFESPLHKAIEREKGQRFLEAKQMLAEAAALDPRSVAMVNTRTALREALEGVGTPAKWLRSEDEMKAIDMAAEEQAKAQALLQTMGQGAAVAKDVGSAGESFARMQQGV